MGKKTDGDKAGISTGTTHITPIGKANMPEHMSKGPNQKPTANPLQSASRGQKLK